MSERGCIVKVEIPPVHKYFEKIRKEKNESTDISQDSKLLIDRVIRYHEKELAPFLKFLNEPEKKTEGEIAKIISNIREDSSKLVEVDYNIRTDIFDCSKVVKSYLTKHGKEPIAGLLLRKPLEEKPHPSPIPELALVVSVSREDHSGILHDLNVRIENSELENMDKEILQAVVNDYKNKVDSKCKDEDKYVEKIKSLSKKLNTKLKPIYNSLKQMKDRINYLEMLGEME